MRTPLAVLAAGCALALALTACQDEATDLSGLSADELLAVAADEMAEVETVRVRMDSDANVGELPVRQVDGQVTGSGDAEGSAQVEQFGQLMELDFVVVGDAFHYRLLGGWQQVPRADAESLYDPSAILDPERGVAQLLRTAGDAALDGTEELDGVDTYRVTATLDLAAAAALLPGAPDGLTGTLWIGADRRLHQAVLALPDGGTATVRLSDFDAPADISAP